MYIVGKSFSRNTTTIFFPLHLNSYLKFRHRILIIRDIKTSIMFLIAVFKQVLTSANN